MRLRQLIRLLLMIFFGLGSEAHSVLAGPKVDACSDLQHTIDRLPEGQVLLPSFPTVSAGPLNQAAFLYDNAVAIIAFIGCGDVDSASRIGKAIIYAQDHDRFWRDGRLRNGYLAGKVGDGPIKLAGWWDDQSQSWLEDRYQAGSDSGNLAWAMLALLALHHATPADRDYLDAATKLGSWLKLSQDQIKASDSNNPGGFRGGTFGHEPTPERVQWKATEHNTDLAAAFSALASATSDDRWTQEAHSAERFVAAMWMPEKSCYAAGTGEDGKSKNLFIALDAQIWPILSAVNAHKHDTDIQQTCLPLLQQGNGYAYSAALHGIWTEGTAQAAVLMKILGRDADAQSLLKTIDRLRASSGGFYATDQTDLPTGFMLATDPSKPRLYFHLPHLGAAAWAALAQRGVNPFSLP